MHRIDNKSAAKVMPVIGAIGPHPNHYFTHGDPLTNVMATQVDHDFLNSIQENICYAIEQLGTVLDKADSTQLYDAIQQYIAIGPIGGGGGGLTNVQGDLHPKLGGNLNVNGHSIVSSSSDLILYGYNIDLGNLNVYVKSTLVGIYNKIIFDASAQDYLLNDVSILDINSSGLRLGAAGARVNKILDDDTMSANDNTALVTQQSAKAYANSQTNKPYYLTVIKSAYAGGSDPRATITGSGTIPARYFLDGGLLASTPSGGYHSYAALQMPRNATISNLKFFSSNTWSVSTSTDIIEACLFVNGVATALKVTMVTNAGAPNVEDTTHSINVNAGDFLEINLINTKSGGSNVTIIDADISVKILNG